MVKFFEDEYCFKTYPLERDPSVSANINVLVALLHTEEPLAWAPQITKIVEFLCGMYEKNGSGLRDKWVTLLAPYGHVGS